MPKLSSVSYNAGLVATQVLGKKKSKKKKLRDVLVRDKEATDYQKVDCI